MLHRWSQWAANGVTVFEGANKLALIRNVQSACYSLQHVCYMTMQHAKKLATCKKFSTCENVNMHVQISNIQIKIITNVDMSFFSNMHVLSVTC